MKDLNPQLAICNFLVGASVFLTAIQAAEPKLAGHLAEGAVDKASLSPLRQLPPA